MKSKINKLRPYVIPLLVVIILYVGMALLFRYFNLTSEAITNWAYSFGIYAFIALFAAQFIVSLTPMPDAMLTLIGMVMYGPIIGSLIIFAGMIAAGYIHFYVAKKYGRDYIVKKFPQVGQLSNKITGNNIIQRLVYIRMFAFITFDITSYIAGISGASFWQFTLSFAIGLIPNFIINALIVNGLVANGSPLSIIPALTILALIYIIAGLQNKKKISDTDKN